MSTAPRLPKGRPAITIFEPPTNAPLLQDTGMLSMPVADPPAPEQMQAWMRSGGGVVKLLFRDDRDEGHDGMSLVWLRYAPGYPLPRHSHDVDCLYVVIAGEARLGRRTIPPGGGFFAPAGARYAYTAGPAGVEVLEFRGVSSFETHISESAARWDQIVDVVRERQASWTDDAET